MIAIRRVYTRDHFYQVLLTFGLILVIDELVRSIWGLQAKLLAAPPGLGSSVDVLGSDVSAYRLFIIGFGVVVSLVGPSAVRLYSVIAPFGFLILILLISTPVLGNVFQPFRIAVYRLVFGGLS